MRAYRTGSEVSGLPSKGPPSTGAERPPGAKAPPNPSEFERLRKPLREPRPPQTGDLDHRRGQHQTLERASPGVGDAEHDRRAHGMTEPEPGRRAGRPQHVADEGVEVALIERKIVDMTLARILQLPRRPALAAPIERRDREAAIEQLSDRLEILLNEFGAAQEQRDRASHPPRRRPARSAQSQTVDRAQRFDDRAGRNGIIGRDDERHEAALSEFGVLWRVVAHGKARAGLRAENAYGRERGAPAFSGL